MFRNQFLGKLFWSLAPLIWGTLTWILAFGPGRVIPLPYSIRMVLGILLLITYFYPQLTYSAQHYTIQFFGYPVPIPNWRSIFTPCIALLLGYWVYGTMISRNISPIICSLIFGVFASPCLEELVSRTIFIKYRMNLFEFIFFNVLSAFSFTLMHAGYTEIPQSLYQLFFINGHFFYSFLLGLIAYKTQRLELTIILHMASNFLRYTLPVVILGAKIPALGLAFQCLELLIVAGAIRKKQ